jgi:hypothetical protein
MEGQWVVSDVVGLGFLSSTPTRIDRTWFSRVDDQTYKFVGSTASEQAAAVAMNNALLAHGYKSADQGVYRAFQAQEGITPDGFPGSTTMQYLKDVLFSMGIEIAPVKVYTWSASGGYDGVNAPSQAEWLGGGGSTLPVIVVPGSPSTNTTTTTSSTTLFGLPEWAVWSLGAAAVGGVALVLWSFYGKPGHRGARGPRGLGAHHHHAHENALTERPRKKRRKGRRRSRGAKR